MTIKLKEIHLYQAININGNMTNTIHTDRKEHKDIQMVLEGERVHILSEKNEYYIFAPNIVHCIPMTAEVKAKKTA